MAEATESVLYWPGDGAHCYFSLPQCAKMCGVPYRVFWYHVRMNKLPEPGVVADRKVYDEHGLLAATQYFNRLHEEGKARWKCHLGSTKASN